MKTSHFSENYDLCHPLLGCENSNNNSNISSNIANSYSHQQQHSKTSSAIVTYGNSSEEEQTNKFENNANDFQIKQQLRQQQEQNNKRKRETGEYIHDEHLFLVVCISLLFMSSNSLHSNSF